MSTPAASTPPTITPSVLRAADQCALRFHRLLAGGGQVVAADRRRRFALSNALTQACLAAHARVEAEGGTIAEALADLPPPADLTPEERHALEHALATYGRLAAARPALLDPRSGQRFPTQVSRSGRFAARAVLDLVLRRVPQGSDAGEARAAGPGVAGPGGAGPGEAAPLEVRELALRPAEDPASGARATLAALVLGAPLVHAHWDLREGRVTEATLTREDVAARGARLQERVLATLDAPAPPAPTPGRWCSGCPVLRSCPAVVHTTGQALRAAGPA